MWDDPIVAEVRKIRQKIAAKFKYDVRAICRGRPQAREEEQASDSVAAAAGKGR